MSITYLKGDATVPQAKGQKIIAHIVNTLGGWGAGFVLAISDRWKEPEAAYRDWYKRRDGFELGKVLYVKVKNDLWVANMLAQQGLRGGSKGPPIRYDALGECLADLGRTSEDHNASIHMPRIGCALGGGRWSQVEPLLQRTLRHRDVYVYDFAGGVFNP